MTNNNYKNNAGYVFNQRDTTDTMEYLEEMKGLPFGIYRYDNLGEVLLNISNINIVTRHFSDIEDFKSLKGFLIVEKYNIPSRFKFILEQKISNDINIIYAYINDNNDILITDTMSGSDKFIHYNKLKELEKDNLAPLLYNDRYVSKAFILTHIFPFSLFHNDTEYINNNFYDDDTSNAFRYHNSTETNSFYKYEYMTFYLPIYNNKNRTLINAINANKIK